MKKMRESKRNQKRHGEIVFEEQKETIQLDLKDKKILGVLAKNSRTPLTVIGKIVGLSQENVLYRINRLKEQHIIVDVFTAIDSRKLGILSFVVFIKFSKISKEKEEQLIESLLNNNHVSWLTTTAGQFDMMIFMQAMSVYEFESEWQKILKEYGENFSETDIGIMTEYGHRPSYYPIADTKEAMQTPKLQLPYQKEIEEGKKEKNVPVVDNKDLEILRMLLLNSRIKLTELGQKVGMSSQNVDFRIKHLAKKGVITGFGYRPNYQKLQFQYYTVRLKASVEEREKLKAFVLSLPNILYYFQMLGQWTFSFHLFFKDVRDLNEFLTLLRENFGDSIEAYDSTIHLDQYYYTYIAEASYRALLASSKKS